MKKVLVDRIVNIPDTPSLDKKFLFSYFDYESISSETEVFELGDLLKKRENKELLNNLGDRYAMWSEVYSPKDELEIFNELCAYAKLNNKKIHISGITLKEELDILEEYYIEEGYSRIDANCFIVDYEKTLISVGVNIENLMWRGSDYKAQKDKIFFIPPIRESGQNKVMYKGINRGSIACINIKKFDEESKDFLCNCITEERILPITLGKVLKYNLEKRGFKGEEGELVVDY